MIFHLKPTLRELLNKVIGSLGSFAPKLDEAIQNPKFEASLKPDFTRNPEFFEAEN